jgi:uncharacterized protein
MGKLLIVLLVGVVAAWLIFGRRRKPVEPVAGTQTQAGREEGQAMVACAHCGLHLPRGDAIADGDASYCSPAHRAAGPRAR